MLLADVPITARLCIWCVSLVRVRVRTIIERSKSGTELAARGVVVVDHPNRRVVTEKV